MMMSIVYQATDCESHEGLGSYNEQIYLLDKSNLSHDYLTDRIMDLNEKENEYHEAQEANLYFIILILLHLYSINDINSHQF